MPKFTVSIPIVGSITYEVSAKDAKSAKDEAWERYHQGDDNYELEWDAVDVVCEGNVCHAPTNEVEATRHE